MAVRPGAFSDLAHELIPAGDPMSFSVPTIAQRQARETIMSDSATAKREALTPEQLDRVAGGIIIVGGAQRRFTSALERVALNPQPLPPKTFSFGH